MKTNLEITNKRLNRVNVDLFNSHKTESAHSAKINYNRLFKVEHYSLNSVLNTILKQFDSNAFKTYLKTLKNNKGITIKKEDLKISSLKQLFNSADFVINYNEKAKQYEYRNYIFRLKQITSEEEASVIRGTIKIFGVEKEYNNQTCFVKKVVNTKEGEETQFYTIVPKTNFSAWELLGLIEKFKTLELKAAQAKKETETEAKK